MKLIKNWKQGWKMVSIHIAAVIAILACLQAYLPSFQTYLPPFAYTALNAVLGLAVVVARLVQQDSLKDKEDVAPDAESS